jgi:hypothetical protein
MMSGIETQRSILAAEFYWFGGCQAAPKVYDGGTNFNAPPTLRSSAGASSAIGGDIDTTDALVIRYESDDSGWTVTLLGGE